LFLKRKYQCPICAKNFSCKDKLKHHIDVKHENKKPSGGGSSGSGSGSKKSSKRNTEDLKCGYPNCTKLFANKYNVKRHIENVHLKMRRRRHHNNSSSNNNKTNSSASCSTTTTSSSANTSLNNTSTTSVNNSNVSLGGGLNLTNGHQQQQQLLAKGASSNHNLLASNSIIALQMPGGSGNVMSSPIIATKMEPTLSSTPNKKHSASIKLHQQQQQQQQQQLQQIQSLNAFTTSNLNLAGNAVCNNFHNLYTNQKRATFGLYCA
jgi:hypothetical protein